MLLVLSLMALGQKWTGWTNFCISMTRFFVLINETLLGFFQSSKGLGQGNLVSSHLFIPMMEVFSCFTERMVEGGFISGFNIDEVGVLGVGISHFYLQMIPCCFMVQIVRGYYYMLDESFYTLSVRVEDQFGKK